MSPNAPVRTRYPECRIPSAQISVTPTSTPWRAVVSDPDLGLSRRQPAGHCRQVQAVDRSRVARAGCKSQDGTAADRELSRIGSAQRYKPLRSDVFLTFARDHAAERQHCSTDT